MSAGRRVALLVALVAAAAVAVVAVAVVSSDGESATPTTEGAGLRPGRPPVSLALGFRDDPEARDLVRADTLYEQGKTRQAAALFAKHDSLEAKVGAALASWPEGSLDRLEQLGKLYPEEAVVQLHLGLARLWANEGDPLAAWRAAAEAEPDTPYAILAGNVLYPKLPRGLPTFIPSFVAPTAVTKLPPGRQLEALRVRAERGVRELLLYGVGLQRVGRPVSAARVYDRAAREAPRDAEAQVAAAVGAFDKANPSAAFGRLGPLSRRFPHEPSVRFHLGVLLLWTARVDEAERQLRLASRTRPGSLIAGEAKRYLEAIEKARS